MDTKLIKLDELKIVNFRRELECGLDISRTKNVWRSGLWNELVKNAYGMNPKQDSNGIGLLLVNLF